MFDHNSGRHLFSGRLAIFCINSLSDFMLFCIFSFSVLDIDLSFFISDSNSFISSIFWLASCLLIVQQNAKIQLINFIRLSKIFLFVVIRHFRYALYFVASSLVRLGIFTFISFVFMLIKGTSLNISCILSKMFDVLFE
jgi:hypothetical protein